jgi:hypothetical protein
MKSWMKAWSFYSGKISLVQSDRWCKPFLIENKRERGQRWFLISFDRCLTSLYCIRKEKRRTDEIRKVYLNRCARVAELLGEAYKNKSQQEWRGINSLSTSFPFRFTLDACNELSRRYRFSTFGNRLWLNINFGYLNFLLGVLDENCMLPPS